jgi:hypothetical protein
LLLPLTLTLSPKGRGFEKGFLSPGERSRIVGRGNRIFKF